ncbi:MAG: hypothetical protein K2P84_07360 [Undibacterium sp.]|nr:hypothetical protein [Undibacterium sp.]
MSESTYSQHEKSIAKTYFIELGLAMILYVVILIAAVFMAKSMQPGLLRTLVVLSPTIPCGLALWAIIRMFKRMDEYLKMQALETLAISGAITTMFGLSYGFLEGVDFPRLSGFIYYGVFMGSWFVIACGRKFLGR